MAADYNHTSRPRCPRCGKSFATESSVLRHLNQPESNCRLLYDNVEHFQVPSASLNATATSITPSVPYPPFLLSTPPTHDTLRAPILEESDPFLSGMNMDVEQANVPEESIFSHPRADALPYFREEHPNAPRIFGRDGETFMDRFSKDEHAGKRSSNLYYPFATRAEWELGAFLLRSNLSMSSIDEFLKLDLIRNIGLSFKTARDLRTRADILPSGPRWQSQTVQLELPHPTKYPIILYHRNPLECIESLLRSPLLKDHLDFTPFRLFETAARLSRVFTEWLSGDAAWFMQNELPSGATLLGTILSSDKTNISAMTGGRVAHPLLISLANISMEFRNKASNHAFLLLALIPIPKFLNPKQKTRGVLEARLFHQCLEYIFKPLFIAAKIGAMMTDPVGNVRWCFPIPAAYIVDTPESALIANVAGKTSSVTMADYRQFGDPFQHPPRHGFLTIRSLDEIAQVVNPWDLDTYIKESMKRRLGGVHQPFWKDWFLADPSVFLTSEPLHHWHKQFWDHDVKWCIFVLGAAEIDFRFSVLHPRTGYRHFREGISSLKQVTGREQRDIQRYLITVIADAVSPQFLVAIRSLLDFRYLAQAKVVNELTCSRIDQALQCFHAHKHAILEAGARRGKNGPINNWEIPKLEFLQSVVSGIRYNGVPIQWSADITERLHIPLVKDPARSGNNQKYELQICRALDCLDKLENFDLATAIKEAGIDFHELPTADDRPPAADLLDEPEKDAHDDGRQLTVNTTSALLSYITAVGALPGSGFSKRSIPDYFYRAKSLQRGLLTMSNVLPHRTYQSSLNSVFHLTRDPSFKRTTIDFVASQFNLPDLRPAIADYIARLEVGISNGHVSAIGGRRLAKPDCFLDFTHLEIWTKVRLQCTAYYYPHDILPPITINAAPPSDQWPHGHSDSVIVNLNSNEKWPQSGLKGHTVCKMCLIFRIIPTGNRVSHVTDRFLCYVQRYDIVPQLNSSFAPFRGLFPEPLTGLYLLKQGRRASGDLIGDIIPLDQVRASADVAPRLGPRANRRFTKDNSLHFATEFWLNKYSDKEMFYALSS